MQKGTVGSPRLMINYLFTEICTSLLIYRGWAFRLWRCHGIEVRCEHIYIIVNFCIRMPLQLQFINVAPNLIIDRKVVNEGLRFG